VVIAANGALLATDEPAPVIVTNISAASPFLLIGDHAGNAIPRALSDLGLPPDELCRHIAWDIGIAALGRALAARLDAPFIAQRYSRLVIDCNRDPARGDAIPPVSDGTVIPANQAIGESDRAARAAAIQAPYQQAIADALAARDAAGRPTILVALHSFTPRMAGFDRPWLAGVLHNGADDRFARALLAELRRRVEIVGDNEPYMMDGTDYTVPLHAFAARRPYAEIEVRQDQLADEAGVARWAALLGQALFAVAESGFA